MSFASRRGSCVSEGDSPKGRIVVIKFDSMEKARHGYCRLIGKRPSAIAHKVACLF